MNQSQVFERVKFRFLSSQFWWLMACAVSDPVMLNGQEFRIESQVYGDESKLPVSQNVTLFSDGLVYDFQLSNDAKPKTIETVVYDSRARVMVLLDPQRQVRTELPDLRLLKIVDSIRRETIQDDRSSFLVEDEFVEEIDWSTNSCTLTSPQIVYRFKGEQPADVSVLPPYFAFLENFTRLIASDPTKIPPFPRMKLNQVINRLGWIPSEVHFSVKQNSLFREAYHAKSKHVLINQLSDNDRSRIATAKQHWMYFELVDLADYRGLNRKSKKGLPEVMTASYEEPVINPQK